MRGVIAVWLCKTIFILTSKCLSEWLDCATLSRLCTFDAKSTKSLSPKKALALCFAPQNNPATVRYEPTLPNGKLRRLRCKLGRLLRALRWFLAVRGVYLVGRVVYLAVRGI